MRKYIYDTGVYFNESTHVDDHEPTAGGIVLGLPGHDSAVNVVGVRPRREDKEERSHPEKDVDQIRNRFLNALLLAWRLRP